MISMYGYWLGGRGNETDVHMVMRVASCHGMNHVPVGDLNSAGLVGVGVCKGRCESARLCYPPLLSLPSPAPPAPLRLRGLTGL